MPSRRLHAVWVHHTILGCSLNTLTVDVGDGGICTEEATAGAMGELSLDDPLAMFGKKKKKKKEVSAEDGEADAPAEDEESLGDFGAKKKKKKKKVKSISIEVLHLYARPRVPMGPVEVPMSLLYGL